MHSGLKPVLYMFRMTFSILAVWIRKRSLRWMRIKYMNWKNMMNEKSRTEYSVVNMTVAFIAQALAILMGFLQELFLPELSVKVM